MFYFVFEDNFFKYKPPGGTYIWKGDLAEGFFALRVWGAYIWRGLYIYKEGLIFRILRYPHVTYNYVSRSSQALSIDLKRHELTSPEYP